MSQDSLNDQANAEEPQVVATVPDDQGHLGDLAQPAHSTELAEDALAEDSYVSEDAKEETTPAIDVADDDPGHLDELSEDESDVEEDAADETDASKTASTPADMTTAQSSPTPSANTEDTDDRCEIEKQAYDFGHSTIQIAIQLIPDDGDPNGRMAVVGVRSHLDAPILRVVRLNEIGPLPPLVNTLLDELKAELPAREQAAREAFEKKKEERAKRKSMVTASKTPARGKKTKATTLSTSPTSSANVTDNRPRPDVQATTTPQQQIGLF